MNVVVVGQGYVGLPLAHAAVHVGHCVVGLDLNERRVRQLNAGQSVVDDLSDADVQSMLELGYAASVDPTSIKTADVIVICVPTPLGESREPDLGAVLAATADVAANVRRDALVVLESTTYPGTTALEVAPLLSQAGFTIGADLFLAFSPERVDPGNRTYGIRNTPKVVGADDPESLHRAADFYSTFVIDVVRVSGTAEAEMTKLLENTYRHINIGLVNELAVVCHDIGINVWEVIQAASTKPFGFQPFYPGPGVGGHCIPIDPNYLNHRVRKILGRPFRFVELAEDINTSMPGYVATRAQDLLNERRMPLRGSRILLLGITYKPGISDTRESPADDVARILRSKGAEVSFFDPFVEQWRVDGLDILRVADLMAANRAADLTVLLQPIPNFDHDRLAEDAAVFFDTRGVTRLSSARRL